ncbi:AAA family ATPase [Caproiciproducens sp. CPB-2]|uniref:AAA family ATPase n=1 Tax=Caproiciproducens sp. CPB-2 TaxID=3030017 RepID=UPI0023DC87C8|nr:AAA family ATPase [Caproiciproducens sp. CPB-2]MDF1495389.1 AAA family ATPase [Caproiciproducens sp. CPB-2]
MKINKIYIGHFGKLREYTLDLTDGFQILYGNNEDGKSTVMAFIRMMFYGSEGRSGDLSKNMRKKYQPWDGAKMSGFLEFEDNGTVYRLERLFGASNATDKISLWNTATGEKEKIASGTDLGQRFFGIGAAAFEKSVFIGQAGSMAGADRDDEITQRLLNLVSTGDESVSQKRVETRLQAAMNELKSKSGRIGVLDKGYQQQERLAQERAAALADEEEKKRMERRYAGLNGKKEALEKEYQHSTARSALQEKLVQLQNLDKIVQKQKELDAQVKEYGEKSDLLTSGDIVFDEEFVQNAEKRITQVRSLQQLLEERNRNVRTLEQEDPAEPVEEISPEVPEEVKKREQERAKLQQDILALREAVRAAAETEKKRSALAEAEKALQEQIQQKQGQENACKEASLELEERRRTCQACREDFDRKKEEHALAGQRRESANTAYQAAGQHLKSVRSLSAQKIETAQERLKQAGTPRQVTINENAGREIRKGLLIGAILIAAASVALGVALSPACFAGLALAGVAAVLSVGKARTRAVATTVVDEAEAAAAKANLESVRLAAERETEAAKRAEEEAAGEWQAASAREEQLRKSAAQAEELCRMAAEQMSAAERRNRELELKLGFIDEKLDGLSEDVREKRAELPADGPEQRTNLPSLREELNARTAREAALADGIQSQLESLGCRTMEELQDKLMRFRSFQARAAMRRENLDRAKEALTQAQESLRGQTGAFLSFVSAYRQVSSFEEAVNAVQELKNRMEELRSLRQKIESQSESLKEQGEGKPAEQLEREAGEAREEILSACAGRMPEPLDDQGAEHLRRLSAECFEQLQQTREELIQTGSEIKNRFAGKKNVSELEEEAEELQKEIAERESEYQCLSLAKETLTEAFNEIRQSFGPLLNEKTARIFNSITGGKYQNVIVSKNFDINVQDTENAVSHEWQYLSSGTIDQAYFALRLAVAELLSEEGPKLPLLLDDVFLQYDDERTGQGLKFLADYAGNGGGAQIILFTCHQNIPELARREDLSAVTKKIGQTVSA